MLFAPSLGKQIKWNNVWSANMGKRCGIHGIATRLFERLHPKQDSHMPPPVGVPISRSGWSSEISPIQSILWLCQLIHVPMLMKVPYGRACYFYTPSRPQLTDTLIYMLDAHGMSPKVSGLDVRAQLFSLVAQSEIHLLDILTHVSRYMEEISKLIFLP